MLRARSLSHPLLCLAACVVLGSPAPAIADPERGQTLFVQFCSSCHSPTPGNPIEAGAGNPTAIRIALMSVQEMQVVRQFLNATDIQDLADFLDVRFNGGPPTPPPATLPPPSPPPPVTLSIAVEYHHTTLDHYFITAITSEITALDARTVHQGRFRTGQQFNVWSTAAGVALASPVCRYLIPPGEGNSHFFSASPVECNDTAVKFPQYTFEAAEVFAVALPDVLTGACPLATQPVYRLWNNRAGDSNHRYTTSLATRTEMIALGYVAEGYGPGVVFCAPQ